MTTNPESHDDATGYDLSPEDEERLLLAHNECTFIWSNREGWPVGVTMSYVWRRGRFWLTASDRTVRIAAVRREPRVCVVVTSTGSPIGRNKAVTWKGRCTVHADDVTKGWFYPELAKALHPDPKRAEWHERYLDSPDRVILEVEPVQRIGYDGAKMGRVTSEWIKRKQAQE